MEFYQELNFHNEYSLYLPTSGIHFCYLHYIVNKPYDGVRFRLAYSFHSEQISTNTPETMVYGNKLLHVQVHFFTQGSEVCLSWRISKSNNINRWSLSINIRSVLACSTQGWGHEYSTSLKIYSAKKVWRVSSSTLEDSCPQPRYLLIVQQRSVSWTTRQFWFFNIRLQFGQAMLLLHVGMMV